MTQQAVFVAKGVGLWEGLVLPCSEHIAYSYSYLSVSTMTEYSWIVKETNFSCKV